MSSEPGSGIRAGLDAVFAFEELDAGAGARSSVPAVDPLGLALAEAEAVRERARREGLDAGRAEALAEARPELEAALAALRDAAAAVDRERHAHAGALEREAVALGLRIAEKVVSGALQVQPERVVDVVTGALRGIVDRQRVVVDVNPQDAEVVRAAVGDLDAALGGIAHLEVHAERRVARGGAVVRTEEGELDATVDAKLERAREAVARELGG
jgi:flagellar assembly protein FliH